MSKSNTDLLENNSKIAERFILLGLLLTNLGNALHLLVLGKFLYDLFGSSAVFGGAIAIEQILAVVITIIAGPIVDQWNPVRSVVWTDTLRGVFISTASVLLFLQPSLVFVYAMILVIQMGKPFYKSGIFATEIHLITEDRRAHFNSYSVSVMQLGAFLGMGLAGLIITYSDTRWGFLINGFSFLLSALCVHLASHYQNEKYDHTPSKKLSFGSDFFRSFVKDWMAMVEILKAKKVFLPVLLINSIDHALPQAFNVLLVPLVVFKLMNQSYWLSALDSCFAIGAILAGLVAGKYILKLGLRTGVMHGLMIQSLAFGLIYFTASSALLIVACLLFGLGNTISWTAWQTWMQNNSTKTERGKISLFRHLIISGFTAALIPVVTFLEKSSFDKAALFVTLVPLVGILATMIFSPYMGFISVESKGAQSVKVGV